MSLYSFSIYLFIMLNHQILKAEEKGPCSPPAQVTDTLLTLQPLFIPPAALD